MYSIETLLPKYIESFKEKKGISFISQNDREEFGKFLSEELIPQVNQQIVDFYDIDFCFDATYIFNVSILIGNTVHIFPVDSKHNLVLGKDHVLPPEETTEIEALQIFNAAIISALRSVVILDEITTEGKLLSFLNKVFESNPFKLTKVSWDPFFDGIHIDVSYNGQTESLFFGTKTIGLKEGFFYELFDLDC